MQLPTLSPGKRYALPRPVGSADALLLAQFAKAQAASKKLTAIITADPADTQRLEQELAFFAPGLRVAVFPDWETLPYDTFSPHQDLISERLATLWRIQQGAVDVVLVPAATALVPWRRRASLPRIRFTSSRRPGSTKPGSKPNSRWPATRM